MYNKNIKGLLRIINGLEEFYEQLYKHMDHVYLWDIISSGLLNKKEKVNINIILLEEEDNDMLDKINLVCPESDYSNYKFNTEKYDSIIIYKKDKYYEPIIEYSLNEEKTYFFKHGKIDTINKLLSNIKDEMNCTVHSNNPNNIQDIIDKLPNKYTLKKQLINFNGNVIAGLVHYKTTKRNMLFYLPCRPSSILKNIKYSYIEDINKNDLWNTYHDTIYILNKLYNESSNEIKCNPVNKIIDKGKITGIMTETNQFIKLIKN